MRLVAGPEEATPATVGLGKQTSSVWTGRVLRNGMRHNVLVNARLQYAEFMLPACANLLQREVRSAWLLTM